MRKNAFDRHMLVGVAVKSHHTYTSYPYPAVTQGASALAIICKDGRMDTRAQTRVRIRSLLILHEAKKAN